MPHQITTHEGNFVSQGGRVAIVASRFNEIIVDRLVSGAVDTLVRQGLAADKIEIIRVPGAFEIPLACQAAAESGRFQGVIALGAIIRGSTAHFEYVSGPCASGIMQAQLKTNCPIAFGVLTTDSIEQAVERAGSKAGNKGSEAALTILETMNILEKICG